MITCPACGKENEDSAFECRRCRAPLRDELPPEEEPVAAAPPAHEEASSKAFGTVCPSCEAYNEPGVEQCTSCGAALFGEPEAQAPAATTAEEPPLDRTPAQAFAAPDLTPPQAFAAPDITPAEGSSAVDDELAALALSPEEAAEAMGSSAPARHEEPPLDKTPEQPYAAPVEEPAFPAEDEPTPPPAPARRPSFSAAAAAVAAPPQAEPPPPPPPPAPKVAAPEAPTAPAEKLCVSCGASNPPAAKFCFDCGTPFAKKAPPPPEPVKPEPVKPEPVKAAPEPVKPEPVKAEPPKPIAPIKPIYVEPEPEPAVAVSLAADELTAETPPVSEALHAEAPAEAEAMVAAAEQPYEEAPADAFQDAPPEEAPFEEPAADPAVDATLADPEYTPEPEPEPTPEPEPEPEPEPVVELQAEEPPVDDAPAPFAASLIVEKGAAPGTAFLLASVENRIGANGGHVQLAEDPFVAPHAATLLFAEDHLVLRDEGTANGVYVKVREAAPLEPGDCFIAGERLFRFEGPVELSKADTSGDTPLLGAPRPQGPVTVRISEVLAGGKAGRTCHRSGPAIGIGRTGCDMNFPADTLLAARHAEVRLGEDGSAQVVDLGQGPSGVWVRVRQQQTFDLQAGDLVQIGDQQLRVELG